MSVKRIFDPAFQYRPSYATDVRETFERIRREQQAPADVIMEISRPGRPPAVVAWIQRKKAAHG